MEPTVRAKAKCFFIFYFTASQAFKEAGLTLTGAGSAYPYHKDPQDSHLRIAPTYPSLDEVETASELLCVCVRLAVVEKLLAEQA